jgi:hypothetical protein
MATRVGCTDFKIGSRTISTSLFQYESALIVAKNDDRALLSYYSREHLLAAEGCSCSATFPTTSTTSTSSTVVAIRSSSAMPHSTTSTTTTRRPSVSRTRTSSLKPQRDPSHDSHDAPEKFPDFDVHTGHRGTSPAKSNGQANGHLPAPEPWHPRRDSQARTVRWGVTDHSPSANGHRRQKSLSDAIRTIRTRRGSVSQNAHEIADALKAPVSPRLIVRTIHFKADI